jgi:hypothetical protein
VAYVYLDKGAGHFGDFTHLVDVFPSSTSLYAGWQAAQWMLSNSVDSMSNLIANGNDFMAVYFEAVQPGQTAYWWRFVSKNYGTYSWQDTGQNIGGGTKRYLKIVRSGSTITIYIYSDVARTILVTSFGGTCETTTYRYVYGWNDYQNGVAVGGYVENLDLGVESTNWTQSLSDSVSESDSMVITRSLSLSDSVSESDSIMKDSIKDLNDGVSESDAITKENAKSLSDSVTVIDTEVSNLELTLTENVSVNEALVKGVRKLFSDSVVPTDVEVPVLSYYTYPAYDATMPILLSMYRNVTARFTTLYNSIAYGLFYSLARAITQLAEIDWVTAMKQMNIKTATNNFLALWGSYFGAKRYSGESDFAYSSRIIKRVTAPRNIESAILDAVLSVGGVFFAEIKEQLAGSMFIGYSYIGFDGAPGYEQMSDFISGGIGETPFFFVVFVKIKKNTNFRAILDAINDNRAGGMNYVVQILEEI